MSIIQNFAARNLWRPSQIGSKLAIWVDASDSSTITESSGKISEWRDKSGNGHHFSQATSDNQPTYETAIKNGLNCVRFINQFYTSPVTRQWITNTSFSYSSNKLHLFSVHRNNSSYGGSVDANHYSRIWSMANSSSQDFNNTDGILLTYGINGGITVYRNSAAVCSTSAINDTWCMVDAERDGTAGRIRLNAGSPTTGTTSSANQNIQRTRIGQDFATTDSGIKGWVAEQLVFTDVLTASERDRVQGYLAWKWGLVSNLPSTHTYKNNPPLL